MFRDNYVNIGIVVVICVHLLGTYNNNSSSNPRLVIKWFWLLINLKSGL